jgi:hypothetical protein
MAIELPTYSAVFAFEKRLYAIYDVELPTPVSLFQGAVFLLAVAADVLITRLIGVRLTAGSFWLFVVPPGGAAWLASQPLADHKRPHQWAATRLRHWHEPRTLIRLHPDRRPRRPRLELRPVRVRFADAPRRWRCRTTILLAADGTDGHDGTNRTEALESR